jgi:hypothetical protein
VGGEVVQRGDSKERKKEHLIIFEASVLENSSFLQCTENERDWLGSTFFILFLFSCSLFP